MGEQPRTFGRREFLQATTGTVAVGGATGVASAQNQKKTTTVKVGPNGNYVFTPGTNEPLYITPGTTVKFVWKSDNHNIVVGSQPEGANWQGTPGGKSKTYDTGYTYTHTFETKGKYHYWCQPHKALGMVADIVVNESGSAPGGSGGGGGGAKIPEVPQSAKFIGVTTAGAMVSTLGLAYLFIKYGGEYETPTE